jgi:hypothetical protein
LPYQRYILLLTYFKEILENVFEYIYQNDSLTS